MHPLVSICLPNLNTRPFLAERMESILSQTVKDWELIICDSYSADGAWEFFQKFTGDPRIQIHQVPRAGLYAGWNECLRRARGEYIYIATSDDTAQPQLLERLLQPLDRNPAVDLAVCNFQEIDQHSQPVIRPPRPAQRFLGEWLETPSLRNGKTEFLLHAAFTTTIWVTITSVLFRRRLLQKTGLFRTDLGSGGDEEWSLRAALASDIAFVPDRLATWRIHSAQATGQRPPRATARILLAGIAAVLQDNHSGIPAAWKQIKHWDRQILANYRMGYHESFKLYRWDAKRDLGGFLRNVWQALWQDPAWLATQAAHGFTLAEQREIHPATLAAELIKQFNSPWPPQRTATS